MQIEGGEQQIEQDDDYEPVADEVDDDQLQYMQQLQQKQVANEPKTKKKRPTTAGVKRQSQPKPTV